MKGSQPFPMKDGTGDTSYDKNSSFQKEVLMMVRPLRDEVIRDFLSKNSPGCFMLADLGCSSGSNALLLISDVIDVMHEMIVSAEGTLLPELQVLLNDLPNNDFNTLFKFLPSFHSYLSEKKGDCTPSCFISAWPGSFYKRIFPSRSIHFIHSSSSIHWLSQVPPGIEGVNKRDIYISTSSPPTVREAYLRQFQRDFSEFLLLRSEEMVPGGRMVLTLVGRPSPGHADDNGSRFLGILATALLELAAEGLVNEGDIDSFNMPLYLPYIEEVKQVLDMESSFATDRIETYYLDLYKDELADDGDRHDVGCLRVGEAIGRTCRAFIEPSLTYHFGGSVMDYLFDRYARAFDRYARAFARTGIEDMNIVMISIALTSVAAKM